MQIYCDCVKFLNMPNMKRFNLFSIIVLLISACSDSTAPDVTTRNIDNAPTSIEREIGSEPTEFGTTNEEKFVLEYSALIGKWNIIRFDNYEPTRLSRDGKNHAYVQFVDGHVGFQMECNSAGMPTELGAKGVLKNNSPHNGILATQMGCVADKQERDEGLFSFFANEPRIFLIDEKTLRLMGAQQELILRKRETLPSDLNGVWQLKYVDGVIALYPVRPRYDHLTFRIDGNESAFTGYDGCNRIGAQVNVQGVRLRTKHSKQQLRDCPKDFERTAKAYEDLLFVDGKYEIDGNHLIINSKGKRYDLARLDEPPRRPMPIIERREAPVGTKLCEVRAPMPDDVFSDYPPPVQAAGGYAVRLTDDAIYFDHQDFQFGSTLLSELSTPILFEKSGKVTVVKRVSSYPTRLNFGMTGVYCSAEGEWKKGKVWPNYLSSNPEMAELKKAQPPVLSPSSSHVGTLIDNNGCVGFTPEDQSLGVVNLIFNHWALEVGHDEGGFFLKQKEKTFRVGDKISGSILSLDDIRAQIVVSTSLTHPDTGTSNLPACPKPAMVMMQ